MFRQSYLNHAQIRHQLEQWATAHPDIVNLQSLGRSAEDRDIALLVIGPDPDRIRPAVWVDANMHASEVCGSSVALAIAEDVINIHLGKNEAGGKALPAHMAQALRETLFYVVPRMSPDGAEAVLGTGRYLRSSPVNDRENINHAYWQGEDINGDGLAGYMRLQDPHGDLVELRDEQGQTLQPPMMVPRMAEDEGPYYKLYPEGVIVNYDGRNIPTPSFVGDNLYDFNRNFPHHWEPEHKQVGAGHYPGSAPETRAVIEFAVRHPNIMVWLNLHTFGGVLIRPLGDRPDSKMHPGDLALYNQVEQWMVEHTGYAVVSGFHEFLYEPDKPLHGDLSSFAHEQRGALAYVVELWDLFKQLGIERIKPFVHHYARLNRKDLRALHAFDQQHNAGRIFKPWQKATHPQLGQVELNGYDPRVGISNPPYERLAQTCAEQSAAFLRVAALAPRLKLELVAQELLLTSPKPITRLEVRVVNEGYLATCGIPSARELPLSEPLRLSASGAGLQLLAPSEQVVHLGHLDGWGTGLYTGPGIFSPWTRGNGHERFVTLLVQGSGLLVLSAGSSRVGQVTLEVEMGG